jgi:hypothetical protein
VNQKYIFPFTTNPSLLKSWITAMKWADWMPTKYSVLCEKHFTTDDYINKGGGQVIKDQSKKYLKQNAVPSIFDYPPHLVKTTTSRPLPKKREAPPPPEDQIPAKKK